MVRRTEEKTKDLHAVQGRTVVATRGLAIPLSEIRFRFSRSGGAGGQHANKVSTRVELLFDVKGSGSLNEEQRRTLLDRLAPRLDSSGQLSVVSDASRSQWKNREDAVDRFLQLLRHALTPRKKRVATRAHAGAREKRLQAKKIRSRTKAARRHRDTD
jgi:ribosome-associated protein